MNKFKQFLLRFVKDPKEITVHPKYGKSIEYKFSIGKKHYYKLLNQDEYYNNRGKFLIWFANEAEMKVTKDILIDFMDAIIGCYDVKEGESVNMGKPLTIAQEVKYRTEWLFEPDSLYRLASCVYFTLDEDIRYYDWEYNKKKIARFKKKEMLYYFFLNLMTMQGEFSSFSEVDFKQYLSGVQKVIEKQIEIISKTGSTSSRSKKEKQTTTSDKKST